MSAPEVGSLWRRKARPEFVVKVTEIGPGTLSDVCFEAVDRKPRQPKEGRKWMALWDEAFEPVDESKA